MLLSNLIIALSNSRLLTRAFLAFHAAAWGAVTGTITATVKDQSGLIFAGASVTAANVDQGLR
jgi:hypothetical protein